MRKRGKRRNTIRLKDLAPRTEIAGGSGNAGSRQPAVSLPPGPGQPIGAEYRGNPLAQDGHVGPQTHPSSNGNSMSERATEAKGRGPDR